MVARARESGVRSIAFPAVGTGIAGFPMRECAGIMLDEALRHLGGPTSVTTIRFVLDQRALRVFRDAWAALPSGRPPAEDLRG